MSFPTTPDAVNAAPLGVTMGDPAGIGGEIALKAWLGRHDHRVPTFMMLDDPDRLTALAAGLGWTVPIAAIGAPADAAAIFDRALPVLGIGPVTRVLPGRPDPKTAIDTERSIRRAVDLAERRLIKAVVTNPINKHVMHQGGFAYPGHTEFLAALLGGGQREVMMLACDQLRVVPVTIHVSLTDAIATLTTEAIVSAARVTLLALRTDFGIATPRLAVAGLNPHAGENGDMGREEVDIIAPAVARLQAEGLNVSGPLPSDTMFHAEARKTYDAALCMYHDQALIPIKTLDFDGGVNITLGLSIIRTSPDHGTAYDLAGTGQAHEHSLINALKTAQHIATNRGRT